MFFVVKIMRDPKYVSFEAVEYVIKICVVDMVTALSSREVRNWINKGNNPNG